MDSRVPQNEADAHDPGRGQDSDTPYSPNLDDSTLAFDGQSEDADVVFAAGDLIGRYEVRRLLGIGTFGRVYACLDSKLNREVAVKVSRRRGFDTQEEIDDFLTEARAISNLRHPGIVHVYDCSQQPNGLPFVVMELVVGENLTDHAAGLSVLEKAELVRQAALAVAHAHQHEIVHRDLKPKNILVDHDGQIRILDFGLAMCEDNRWMHKGQYSGTPAYMAPEQIRAEAHRLDGRTDIWALGVILYELLSGQRPFRGGTRSELEDEILHRHPKPPRQIVRAAPARIERICLKCLEKGPRDRFATASDLAEELGKAITEGQKPAPTLRRSAFLAASLGVTLVVCLTAWYFAAEWGLFAPGFQPRLPRSPSPRVGVDARPTAAISWGVDVHLGGSADASIRATEQTIAVINGDSVRIWARLAEARFAAVAWVDSKGDVDVLFPAPDGDAQPTRDLQLPERLDEGYPVIGDDGVEVAVLLLADHPLTNADELRALLVPHAPFNHIGRQVVIDGKPIANGRFPDDVEPLAMLRLRGLDSEARPLKFDESLDQLTHWRDAVVERLPDGIEFHYLAIPHAP